jgi:hypothetical protein
MTHQLDYECSIRTRANGAYGRQFMVDLPQHKSVAAFRAGCRGFASRLPLHNAPPVSIAIKLQPETTIEASGRSSVLSSE